MQSFVLALIGLALLTAGSEALIRGALSAAQRLGVSALLSGLVIVGFGTSTPELVVSVDAALHQRHGIAVGNVVGSNIANILLILGACALVSSLKVEPLALRRDGLAMAGATVLFLVLAHGGRIGRAEGLVLLAVLAGYLAWAYGTERRPAVPAGQMHRAESQEVTTLPKSLTGTILSLLLGLACLIIGARMLVAGAVDIAQRMGVAETVIGLTLVAVGTSLPELAVSFVAALRRHADVAVGNILGSNIFNLCGILGVSALMQPIEVGPRIMRVDQWVMLAAALALVAFLYTGRRLNRAEGSALLLAYVAYVAILIRPG